MGKRKKRKHEYTAPTPDEPTDPWTVLVVVVFAAVWLGGAWYYANGSWGLWLIIVLVTAPLFKYAAVPFIILSVILSAIAKSLSRKLAASRKVQHVNTSRPYDIADIRRQARQAAGLSDES